MTYKDFRLLSDALRQSRPMAHDDKESMNQWVRDVARVADACSSSNPRFNRDTFYRACGIAV